jgi:hypothetical protein
MSPCALLVLFLPKKDVTWRMCFDCREINNITITCCYRINRLDDMLGELFCSHTFSKIYPESSYVAMTKLGRKEMS